MGLNTDEMERLADEMYMQRLITTSTYCGKCGYNLRTLPYTYICPECGQSYNARPLKMKGVFQPHEHEPPTGDAAMGLLSALAALLLIARAFADSDMSLLAMGLVFVALLLLYLIRFVQRLVRYIHACSITRRIERDEAEMEE